MTGAVVNLNGLSPTIENLGTGGGTITNTSGTESVLTLDLSANTTFAGVIQDGGSGTGVVGLLKEGAGT